tara:strand:- start:45 stop:227 length:183 start_codon:yes stop_codon:yes gene_type:complete
MPSSPEQNTKDEPRDESEKGFMGEMLSKHVLDKHHATDETHTEKKKTNAKELEKNSLLRL